MKEIGVQQGRDRTDGEGRPALRAWPTVGGIARHSSIRRLPFRFLCLDAALLAESAGRVRGKDDIDRIRDKLIRHKEVAELTAYATMSAPPAAVDLSVMTHMARGGCLAYELAQARSGPAVGGYPDRSVFEGALEDLYERHTDTDDDKSMSGFLKMVDGVLVAAGMSEHFDVAVGNLRGPGFENKPTSLSEARISAAFMALAIGHTNAVAGQ